MSTKIKLVVAAGVVFAVAVTWRSLDTPRNATRSVPEQGAQASIEATPDVAPGAATVVPDATHPVENHAASVSSSLDPGFEVRGRVVSAISGDPISGALVWVGIESLNEHTEVTVRTDPDGTFVLQYTDPKSKMPERYRVTAPEHALSSQSLRLRGNAKEVDLGDLVLERGARVRGRVVEQGSDRPVAGARVRLLPVSRGDDLFGVVHSELGAVSATDGSFVLPERVAPRGRQAVVVIAESGMGWTAFPVPRDRENIDLLIELQSGLEARVVVTDPQGAPVPAAQIVAKPGFGTVPRPRQFRQERWRDLPRLVGSDEDLARIFRAETDASGIAYFSHLPLHPDENTGALQNGQYTFHVKAAGYPAHKQRHGLSADSTSLRVELEKAEATLLPLIAGRITDRDGSPVEGARVYFGGGQDTSDRDGYYQIENARWKRGPMGCFVQAEGYLYGRSRVTVPKGESTVELDVVLDRRSAITLQVTDQHGVPARNYSLEFNFGSHEMGYRTDENGHLELECAAGSQVEIVTQLPVEPRIIQAGAVDVPVVIERPDPGRAYVAVQVTHALTGEPVELTRAIVHPVRRRRSNTPVKPAELYIGRVSAGPFRPGPHRVSLEAQGCVDWSQEFTIDDTDELVELTAVMGPPGRFTGRVILDDLPAELRPERLWVGTRSSGCFWVTETGERIRGVTGGALINPLKDPVFHMANVAPNRVVHVTVSSEGLAGDATVRVPFGGEAEVQLRLVPAAVVRFTGVELAGRATLATKSGDGPWLERAWPGEGPLDETVRVPAGVWRWRIQERAEGDAAARRYEGQVDAIEGQTVTAVVKAAHHPK